MVNFQPINKSKGFTDSEKLLIKMCDKSFLSLWAYPNLYTDEGINTSSSGKELCDLLIVFDNNIIIFSDKDIIFKNEGNLDTNWKRWYKKAVKKSCNQIFGAEKWIKQFPDRIFLDLKCTQKFPFLQEKTLFNVYRIAVTKNVSPQILNHFGGQSASLLFCNEIINETFCPLFTVGLVDENKEFVHVLDEYSLEVLFNEFDTITDFLRYLKTKEKIINTKMIFHYAGEEELVAFYLNDYNPAQEKWKTLHKMAKNNSVVIGEGFWKDYSSSKEYLIKKEMKQKSFFWDKLIENFNFFVLNGIMYHGEADVVSHEKTLQFLASEDRQSRLFLSMAYLEKAYSIEKNRRSSRIVQSPTNPKLGYVFVFFPKYNFELEQSYRDDRLSVCHLYAFATKIKYPLFQYIAVIATEPIGTNNVSYDLLILNIPHLKQKTIEQIKKTMKEQSILSHTQETQLGRLYDKKMKVKRNITCPCGSGKKYKRCCLNQK